MAPLKLRDRDAVLTVEGMILRVYGYSHPERSYICDVEYAPAAIYKSEDPRAFRGAGDKVFYKFYEDEGLNFVKDRFPEYQVFHKSLNKMLVGLFEEQIAHVKYPQPTLKKLLNTRPKDQLVKLLQQLLKSLSKDSELSPECLGVFGSLLHGFHHPHFSDIDLTVYGRKQLDQLLQTLKETYVLKESRWQNEFESPSSVEGKRWRFTNYTLKEYMQHQRRKLIYGVYKDSGRLVKTEFEPVKKHDEIKNEYDPETRITSKGWVKMYARVIDDYNSPFIPAIYGIEPLETLGACTDNICRVVSYVEEFRMQAERDDIVYVEGNLEEVATSQSNYLQVTLTYGLRYYEQVLKQVKNQSSG